MIDPIFEKVRQKCVELFGDKSDYKEAERKLHQCVMENKNALVTAWVAETGRLPSESCIYTQWIDGQFRMWVDKKPDVDVDKLT